MRKGNLHMPELIRIEVPEPITINARQPDGSMQALEYTFENYVVFLVNGQKSFNTAGPGVRSSISVINALKEMNDAAKEIEEEADTEPAPDTEAAGEVKDAEPEPEAAKADDGEKTDGIEKAKEKPPLLFIVDQADWKLLYDASEAPERGYPFAEMGLAARNFITFMDALKNADPALKAKKE